MLNLHDLLPMCFPPCILFLCHLELKLFLPSGNQNAVIDSKAASRSADQRQPGLLTAAAAAVLSLARSSLGITRKCQATAKSRWTQDPCEILITYRGTKEVPNPLTGFWPSWLGLLLWESATTHPCGLRGIIRARRLISRPSFQRLNSDLPCTV